MKKINFLMALMMAFTLSFVACENPEPAPEPDPVPPTPTETTFEVAVGEVTSSTIAYTVTPSDLEAEYLCVLYDAETVEEFTRDEFLVENLMMELESEARTTGKTLVEYMPEVVDKGAITDGMFKNLYPETKYYIIVFGVDAANDYKANTAVSKTEVTTAEFVGLSTTFEVNTTVDGNSATYEITPSNNDDVWYFYTLPKSTYDAYTDPNGDYQMNGQRFLLFCLEQEINAYRQAGYDDNTIMNTIFHKGKLTLQAKGLNANTEYINQIAGFIVTPEGQVTIATDVSTSTYTTGDAKAEELTLEISVTDVEAMRAAIKITPSDNSKTFCWIVGAWDEVQTAEEVMNGVVAQYGSWMNNGAMLYSGVQDYTGGPGSAFKYKLDAADTWYYVVAFGYAGGVTTEPVMVTFKTLPAPAAEDTTFEMTGSNPTPYGFTVGVTPSESTTYYTFDVMTNEQFAATDFDALVQEKNDGFDMTLEMSQQFDPNATVAQILGSYYYRGARTANASGLAPETTCSGYVMALDAATGHVAKVHKFENIATTGSLGEVNPTVEVVGYYSGDEENGQVFNQPNATKGKSITVVKYANFDGARSVFSAMLGGDATNASAEGMSDAALWGTLSSYWQKVDTKEPYSFYVTNWDDPQTAFVYAVDNNGKPGLFGRCYTNATVENKGNIEDLITLVNEINAAGKSSISVPESIVFGQEIGIKLDVKSVAAAEPKAEVKAEAVAPAKSLAPVKRATSYIRPFYM